MTGHGCGEDSGVFTYTAMPMSRGITSLLVDHIKINLNKRYVFQLVNKKWILRRAQNGSSIDNPSSIFPVTYGLGVNVKTAAFLNSL